MQYEKITQILVEFLQEEFKKANYTNAIVGLSGGLDSAIVATLCKKSFGDNVRAVLMHSEFSNKENIKDAINLCDKLQMTYEIIKIDNFTDAYNNTLANKADDNYKLRMGNFCARVRMMILYDLSVKYKALVVGTSNKSELMLGYGTMFGDLACAINPISLFYKSDLFEYAKYLDIPKEIINKAPSADLWQGQSDEGELGFSYKQCDDALKFLLKESDKCSQSDDILNKVKTRVEANKFKSNGVIVLDKNRLDGLI